MSDEPSVDVDAWDPPHDDGRDVHTATEFLEWAARNRHTATFTRSKDGAFLIAATGDGNWWFAYDSEGKELRVHQVL